MAGKAIRVVYTKKGRVDGNKCTPHHRKESERGAKHGAAAVAESRLSRTKASQDATAKTYLAAERGYRYTVGEDPPKSQVQTGHQTAAVDRRV